MAQPTDKNVSPQATCVAVIMDERDKPLKRMGVSTDFGN
jgi:hypothetical protein